MASENLVATNKPKTAFIPLILSFVSAVISFAFTFLVSRRIGSEEYGLIEFYIGIISTTSILISFGLPSYLKKSTQFYDNKKAFFSNILLIFLVIAMIGVPVFFLATYFGLVKDIGKNISLITVLYICSIFSALGVLVASFYIGMKEPSKSIVFGTIIPHSFVLVASIILLFTSKDKIPDYYVYILILSHIISTLPCLIKYARPSRMQMKKTDLKIITSFYLVALTSSLYSEISKIFQAQFNEGFSSVGVLGVSLKVISVASIFLGVISKITMPEFATYAKNKDYDNLIAYYRKVTRVNSYVVIPFVVAIVMQSTKVLGLFGEDYSAYPWILVILASSSYISHITGPTGTMLLMIGQEKFEILNGVIKLILFLLIGIPLGRRYVWGLPLAIFVADGLINLIKFIEVKHVTKKHPYSWKMLFHILAMTVISVLIFLPFNFIKNQIVWLALNVVVGAGVILLFFLLSPYKEDKQFIFSIRGGGTK